MDLLFSKSHEWVKDENEVYVIGITDYAAKELGDVIFVELPKNNDKVTVDKSFGVVESVKSVSDLISPVTGTVVEVNDELINTPELINQSPFETAWMIKVKIDNKDDLKNLLNKSEYDAFINEEKH